MVCVPLGHSWPGIHWWLSLTASDQGAWVAGMGALAAAVAAVGISIVQFRRDAARERRIAVAIAPALLGDLKLALESVDAIKQKAIELNNVRVANHVDMEEVFRSTSRIRLPTFERFKNQLPMLGGSCAPIVIECYATIVRTVTLVEIELGRRPPTQELAKAMKTLADGSGHLKACIEAAQQALVPLVRGTFGTTTNRANASDSRSLEDAGNK